jgi:hypothetical protein
MPRVHLYLMSLECRSALDIRYQGVESLHTACPQYSANDTKSNNVWWLLRERIMVSEGILELGCRRTERSHVL